MAYKWGYKPLTNWDDPPSFTCESFKWEVPALGKDKRFLLGMYVETHLKTHLG